MNDTGAIWMSAFFCCGSTASLLGVLALIAVLRYLGYRETLKLAEKGLVRVEKTPGSGKWTLVWGVLITALGLAIGLGLYPLGFMISTNAPLGFGPWMLFGLLPTFFGLGLILIYVLTRNGKPPIEKAAPPAEPDSKL